MAKQLRPPREPFITYPGIPNPLVIDGVELPPGTPRPMPCCAMYNGSHVTVMSTWGHGENAKAAIVRDNGGRGEVVLWNDLTFPPVVRKATLEYIKERISV